MDIVFALIVLGMLVLVFLFVYWIIPKQLLDNGIKFITGEYNNDRDDN
jgi:hypothetical protein